ncbi:MAG: hypothetical protein LBV40_06230 [Methanomicrobiales archaeon]|jgi:hypothetical protein|nr:hypothetical protein [Methanomicrobiales archaeon]
MRSYTVCCVVAVFLCIALGVVGVVSGFPVSLDIADLESRDGVISSTITVLNNATDPISQRYLGAYLLPLGTGSNRSIFVGWVALPYLRTDESVTVPFTGVVPSGTVGGTYQFAVLVTTSNDLVSPNFADAAKEEVSIQGGSGSATEATAFPGITRTKKAPNMPNYQITAISALPPMSLHPGTRITPSVSVVNTGGDAEEGTPVSIMLLLGNQVLFPEKATIPSIAADKSATVQLSYKVPDDIYLGAYILRGFVNPYGMIPEGGEDDNVYIVPGSYFISDNWAEEKIAAGGCGCSS